MEPQSTPNAQMGDCPNPTPERYGGSGVSGVVRDSTVRAFQPDPSRGMKVTDRSHY
jgi:hypothetical protein